MLHACLVSPSVTCGGARGPHHDPHFVVAPPNPPPPGRLPRPAATDLSSSAVLSHRECCMNGSRHVRAHACVCVDMRAQACVASEQPPSMAGLWVPTWGPGLPRTNEPTSPRAPRGRRRQPFIHGAGGPGPELGVNFPLGTQQVMHSPPSPKGRMK